MPADGDRLRQHAGREGIALLAEDAGGERAWSWAGLCRQTGGLAAEMAEAAGRGGVIFAEVDNGMESVLSLIAALRTGLPLAVISRRAPESEAAAFRDVLLARGHCLALVRGQHVRAMPARGSRREQLPAESVLLATGGSAGTPKVVVDPRMRTIDRRPRATRPSNAMNWRAGQRQLVIGPLYHTAALTYFIEGLWDGNTLVVQRSFDPSRSVDLISSRGIEWLQVTPYHLGLLARAAHRGGADLSSVRGLLHLSARCPEGVKRRWIDLIGARRVFEMYGATEPVGVTLVRGDEWQVRPGTVGRGFFTHIAILDESSRRLPAGYSGQVYLRSGAARTPGYLTAARGLHRTAEGFATVGDRGHLDSCGYLFLEPRQVSRIQVGGETVYADEVEDVLSQHPAVLDAAVAGVPDQRLGEILVALVVPSGERVTGRDLRDYARSRLARHKVPRHVRLTGQLPRSGTGKLDRRRLAGLAASGAVGRPAGIAREFVPPAREGETDGIH